MLCMCSPAGPFFREARMLSLFAMFGHVRVWPGGIGEYKLSATYAQTFMPHWIAAQKGYDQALWLISEKITQVGITDVFVVLSREDGGMLPCSSMF